MTNTLNFTYDTHLFNGLPTQSGVARACARFQQRFPEYIWNDSVVDGKAYTLPQIRTVLDGVTHGGSRLTDKTDILNQKQSLQLLITMVKTGKFDITKPAFCSLNEIAAREEALAWGGISHGQCWYYGNQLFAPTASRTRQNLFGRHPANHFAEQRNGASGGVLPVWRDAPVFLRCQ